MRSSSIAHRESFLHTYAHKNNCNIDTHTHFSTQIVERNNIIARNILIIFCSVERYDAIHAHDSPLQQGSTHVMMKMRKSLFSFRHVHMSTPYSVSLRVCVAPPHYKRHEVNTTSAMANGCVYRSGNMPNILAATGTHDKYRHQSGVVCVVRMPRVI